MNWSSKNHRWKMYEDFTERAVDDYYNPNNKTKMKKLGQVWRSRTVWTIIVLFVVNGVAGIQDLIPVNVLPYVNGVLGLLAVWFKISPSQNYE